MTIFPLSRRRPAGGSGGTIPPGTYATPQDVADAIAAAVPRSGFMKINTRYVDNANPYDGVSDTLNWDATTSRIKFSEIATDAANGLIALGDGVRSVLSQENATIDNISGDPLIVEVSCSYLELHTQLGQIVVPDIFVQAFPPPSPGGGPPGLEQIDGYAFFPAFFNVTSGVAFQGQAFTGDGRTTSLVGRFTLAAGGSMWFSGGPVSVMQVMIKATAY